MHSDVIMEIIHSQEYDSFKEAQEIGQNIKNEITKDKTVSIHVSIKKKDNGKFLLIVKSSK